MPRRVKTAAALAVNARSDKDVSSFAGLTGLSPPSEHKQRRSTAQGEDLENEQTEMPIEARLPHLWGVKRGRDVPARGAVLKVIDEDQLSKRRSVSGTAVEREVSVSNHARSEPFPAAVQVRGERLQCREASCHPFSQEQRPGVPPVAPTSRFESPRSSLAAAALADDCVFTVGGEETLADHFCSAQLFVTPRWSDNGLGLDASQLEAAHAMQMSPFPDSHSPVGAGTAGEACAATPWVSTSRDVLTPTLTGEDDATAAVDAARAATAALFSDFHTGLTPRTPTACGVDVEPLRVCMRDTSPVSSPFVSGAARSVRGSRKSREGGSKGDFPAAAGSQSVRGVSLGASACETYYLHSPAFCSFQVGRLSTGSASSVDSVASEGCDCRSRCVHGQSCSACLGDCEMNQYPIVVQQAYLASEVAAGEARGARSHTHRKRGRVKEDPAAKASAELENRGRNGGTKLANKKIPRHFLGEPEKAGRGMRGRPSQRSVAGSKDEGARLVAEKLASVKNQKAQQDRWKVVERILVTAEEEKRASWWRDDEAGDKLEGEESEEEDESF
uniref:Uncharacterized protein n=1 Tax=Neospora caninum (strain Liverpool) TaxID=572307 RepID=A0A0F7UHL3_NEOCL|nr:TPA: hypothetical protein BN1204_035600 [Neospora caninum Liverpool]